jgi:cytochrome c551/c552
MANSVGSEQRSQPKPPARLVVFMLLLGTLLAWWGTRDHRRLFGEARRKPVAAGEAALPQITQDESSLVARGAQISQLQCAGCHEMAARSSGPSYKEIVNFYRREFPNSTGDSELRARLAAAVTHPRPGWGNFAPGPVESNLSVDDRIALATWILRSFDRDRKPGEGAGK